MTIIEPAWGTPEWHRKHPIFGTDFNKPPSVLIEEIRNKLSHLRGQLSDIGKGYSGWNDQLDEAQGAVTLVISYLHHIREEMEKIKL